MLDLINKAAENLTALGIKARDRVVISCDGYPEFAITVVALWKIGAVAVPASPGLPKSLADELFFDLGVSIILDKAKLKEIAEYDKSVLHFCPFDSLGLDLNAEASIIFTSASTSLPKAVVHTIGNHYYSALGSAKNIPFAGDDCWAMSLPMFHISGFSIIMRALIGAASICFPEVDEDDSELNTKITHVSFVPTILLRLLNKDFQDDDWKECKAILLGGAAIPRTLIEKAKELNLPIHTTYGLTELCSQVATDGKVLPYRELMIADDGEILVKGKTLFKGYLRKGKIELPLDANGYFATGDIGKFDADGNLQITGRKDLMFISGGENIYPEQIERALYNIDNIEQAVVVPIDDPEFGQRPVAFIQTSDSGRFDAEKIKTHLLKELESFKVPVAFYTMAQGQLNALKPGRGGLTALAKEYYLKKG